MDFRDFPMVLGKSGMDLIQPPKLCAGLAHGCLRRDVSINTRGVPFAYGHVLSHIGLWQGGVKKLSSPLVLTTESARR